MNKKEMIRNLEYLSGSINAILLACKTERNWYELLSTWSTLVGSITNALEEEEDAENN